MTSERLTEIRQLCDAATTALPEALAEIDRLTRLCEERRQDALYHADCRPNRQQAEQAMADAKSTNDRWADEVHKSRVLREAAGALIAKLDAAAFGLTMVAQVAQIHGCPYTGPTYGAELEALRGLIGERR